QAECGIRDWSGTGGKTPGLAKKGKTCKADYGCRKGDQNDHQEGAQRIESEDVNVGHQHHLRDSQDEQNKKAPEQEEFNGYPPPSCPLCLYRDPDAECERKQAESLELHEFAYQQINGVVDPAGVRVEVENVLEQRNAEEIKQI